MAKKIQLPQAILVPIQDIKNNPNNPRIIKDYKFKKLVKSILDFPQMLSLRPIIVNSEMIVLGGNMRLKACMDAGLKEVPIIKVDDLTEQQQKEFIVKDNVAFGEWDWDVLANEWDENELKDWGIDTPNFGDLAGLETTNDDSNEWVGMPDFEKGESSIKAIINFATREDRENFEKKFDIRFLTKGDKCWNTWFPYKETDDISSLKYE